MAVTMAGCRSMFTIAATDRRIKMQRIFEPYYRSPAAVSNQIHGTGWIAHRQKPRRSYGWKIISDQ